MEVVSIVPSLTMQHPGESKNEAENVVFLHSKVQTVAMDQLWWDTGKQPSGKILSLDRQGAKKVLEIYVRRSLSCCENSLLAKKKLQEKDQEEESEESDLDEALNDNSKAPGEINKEEPEPRRKRKTQRSWFKSLFSVLFKMSPENQKENRGQKAREKDAKALYSSRTEGAKRAGRDSSMSPPLGRTLKSRPSLKRVFSFKKHTEEEWGETAARMRAKQLSSVLRSFQVPVVPAAVEQLDSYYTQVSDEIGQIIQGSESQGSRARGCGEPPQLAGTEGVDEAIKTIVALLQSAGDELDRQVKEDARLQMFFRDMSYSSFKNLADAYILKEMTVSRTNVNPQEIQFAFAVHLTAKVAGICNQAVNRIMGFGNRYLEDSFAPLSYNKILQDREKFSIDSCESPD
ncbi:PREDICTED: apoptosis facilitator Bcl-2-like protein 14 [Chlamydotis macqueenii]|uniref:apoptosis facilitator Bcl-2-like protein 14 n=1 Tax=Chlamydotis macqueenii TaxID=187382 RepID=UPI000529E757|nr:PREDICTED: apoptosis facilitator Bcl-2-like protein 14 [Chlamydotis macqueenii]